MRDRRFLTTVSFEDAGAEAQVGEARRLGREAGAGPAERGALEAAWRKVAGRSHAAWDGFHEELLAAASEEGARRAAWITMLRTAVEEAVTDPGSLAMLPREANELRGLARAWKGERDPLSIWRPHGWEGHYIRDGFLAHAALLLRLSPEEGTALLDALPSPGMMTDVLSLHIREDRDLIERVVAAAPAAFDADGAWVASRSVAALLSAELVVEHARELREAVARGAWQARVSMDARPERLREAEEALRTVQEAELPAWMRRAFDILLGRADGRWVALSLLAYLGRRTLLGPSAHGFEPRWSVDACGLEALARALAATGTQVDDVRKFSRDRELVAEEESSSRRERRRVHGGELPEMDGPPGEGERRLCGEGLPLLLGAAAMAGVDAGPDEASALFDWLVELLEGRDPGLELAGHGAPLEELPRRLGRLLLRLPEPAPSLKGAYQRLEPQRRRGLFAHRYREPARDLESVLLLRTALHVSAADPESRSRLDASGRHELFHWTYEAARRLWLTAPWDPGREKEELVTLCFAFMPHVFGGAIGEALRRVVPPIAAEPAMICRAACLLWRNGLEPEQVQILLADAGVDLQAALLAARDWSTLTRREDDFPSAFQELASGLGLELTARGP